MAKIAFVSNFFLVLFIFAVGCSTTTQKEGYYLESFDLSEINIGKDTKSSISAKCGEPSTSSIFSDKEIAERWYYISRVLTESPAGKKTISNQVICFTFDKQGILKGKEIFLGENAPKIFPKKTKEDGYKTTVWKDTLKNIGKFGQSDLNKTK
jgi:outer membrane protein assembly factor BamE (lipoprotein component of BamABCDE complex)